MDNNVQPHNKRVLWAEVDSQTMRLTGKTVYAPTVENTDYWCRLDPYIEIMVTNGTKPFSAFAKVGNRVIEVPEDIDLSFLSYISADAWPDLEAIDFKWTSIPWLPLDIPKIEPDDWELFWKLWNEKVQPVGSINIGKDGEIKSPTMFQGLGIWKDPLIDSSKFNYPYQEFEDWEVYFPKMFAAIRALPYSSIEKVLLWQNVREIQPHFDPDFQLFPWPESLRIMIWDSNDRPTFFMAKWPTRTPSTNFPLIKNKRQGRGYGFRSEFLTQDDKMYVDLPPDTNSFVFNNGAFVHGADFEKPKIIMVVKGRIKTHEWLRFLESSYNKYKHLIPDCRLQNKDNK